MKLNRKAFTLIELIIVIAIIALIAAAVFVSVNPAKRIGESKDAQRWADTTALTKAVDTYTADNGQLPSDFSTSSIGVGTKVVLCSAASQLTCDGQTNDCMVVDDNDFLGTYIASMPIDPDKSDTSDTGYYITRTSGDLISFGACEDYGDDDDVQVMGRSKNLAYIFTCDDSFVDERDGQSYFTVQIGTQCWMAENLNVGTRVGVSTEHTDNAIIEKYCYNDSEDNCNTLGGLYQWDESMDYNSGCNGTGSGQPECSSPVQGICPSGWHVPSLYEL